MDGIITQISGIDDYISSSLIPGNSPLQDWKRFYIDIHLRIELQMQLFGYGELIKGSVLRSNQKFYQWSWANNAHICEECCKPLYDYSAVYISHILTRGSNPNMAHDPRNKRILCGECHSHAEDENTHQKLKIYPSDIAIIEILKQDYNINIKECGL